ncbi:Ig-like domain-containing protein [Providencia vermicola]|uniref:Ig-like domain-containing protein n=1 Tax=Providencia vermicola TaxID=333965 RepID=UPI0034E60186
MNEKSNSNVIFLITSSNTASADGVSYNEIICVFSFGDMPINGAQVSFHTSHQNAKFSNDQRSITAHTDSEGKCRVLLASTEESVLVFALVNYNNQNYSTSTTSVFSDHNNTDNELFSYVLKNNAQADGKDTNYIVYKLLVNGQPKENEYITFDKLPATSSANIAPAFSVTDSYGQLLITITDTKAESVFITAHAVTENIYAEPQFISFIPEVPASTIEGDITITGPRSLLGHFGLLGEDFVFEPGRYYSFHLSNRADIRVASCPNGTLFNGLNNRCALLNDDPVLLDDFNIEGRPFYCSRGGSIMKEYFYSTTNIRETHHFIFKDLGTSLS